MIDKIKEEYIRKPKFRKRHKKRYEVFNVVISKSNQERFKKYLISNLNCHLIFCRKENKCFIYAENKTDEVKVRKLIFYQLLKLEKEFEFNKFELNCDEL